MINNNVEMAVLVNGKPVKMYGCNGKTYIAANYGTEYSIRIRNNNSFRVLAVCSVDGLSVLDGKEASKDGGGYVINAYSSYEIKGFRSDNDTVGAFKFTKKNKGYAKEMTGSAKNSGIIAVAVFAEKVISWPSYGITWTSPLYGSTTDWYSTTHGNTVRGGSVRTPETINENDNYYTNGGVTTFNCSTNLVNSTVSELKAFNCVNDSHSALRRISVNTQNAKNQIPINTQSAKEEVPDFNAATTWGSKVLDSAKIVDFERSCNAPMAEFELYYDIKPNLEKIGIVFETEKQIAFPKAFPVGFAKPPSGWRS